MLRHGRAHHRSPEVGDRGLPCEGKDDRRAGMAARKKKSIPAKPSQSTHGLPPATEKDVRVRVLKGHTDRVWRVAMPEDGRFALTSSDDGTVRRWALAEDGAEGKILCKGKTSFGLAVTADGSRAAAGGVEGIIRIFEVSTARVLRQWKVCVERVSTVAFHAGGRELLSAAEDGYVHRWNAETGARIATWGEVSGFVDLTVASAQRSAKIVCGIPAVGLALWSGREGAEPVVFTMADLDGSPASLSSVSLLADGRFAFTGSGDGKVEKWSITEGRRVAAFEGHSGRVYAVAVTPDGRFCVSGGEDHTVRLWAAETGEPLAVLRGHSAWVNGIAITPDARRIASVSEDKTLRVWDIPAPILARAAISRKRGYVNAKVVLLGESRVGKTGLANRLWHNTWQVTDSTHGMEVRRVQLSATSAHPEIDREMWLWDLAGQPEYRLTHQLFIEQTALAVVVVDRQRDDLFSSANYWQQALGEVTTATDRPYILVAGRCDEPGQRCTVEEMKAWAAQNGFYGPILTAAKDGKHPGAAELRALIEKLLPWDKLEFRSTQENFPALKDAILAVRDAKGSGGVVVKPEELEARVRKAAPHVIFTPEDLRAVTGLLAGEGVLHALPYGDLVVLQPSWVNCYASTLVKLAGEAENKLGHVPLETIQPGKLPADGTPRLSAEDEQQLLPALVALFLERALAWKQETSSGTMLVFPNYVRLPRPVPPPRPGRTVVYRFTGPLEEIYCTLVVRLHYSGLFSPPRLYRNAADFPTATGRLAALTMRESGECGELDVYFGDKLDADVQAAFQQFVHDHLTAKAKDVERLRNYFCPKCKEEVTDRRAIDAALAKKRTKLVCNYCDPDDAGVIDLKDVLEQQFISKEGGEKADEAGRTAGEKISNASKEQIMVGDVMRIVGEVDQILRHVTYRDEGVDAEIEFNDDKGRGTRTKLDLQLKAGDSHLYKRADGTETFDMKDHYERYWSGKGKPDVLLIIRNSDGRIRYMNATKSIHAAQKKAAGKPVKQIVFTGDDFTKEAVLKLRDERLR